MNVALGANLNPTLFGKSGAQLLLSLCGASSKQQFAAAAKGLESPPYKQIKCRLPHAGAGCLKK
jgi:hypothetical protein